MAEIVSEVRSAVSHFTVRRYVEVSQAGDIP
jgi:hypothetical protein